MAKEIKTFAFVVSGLSNLKSAHLMKSGPNLPGLPQRGKCGIRDVAQYVAKFPFSMYDRLDIIISCLCRFGHTEIGMEYVLQVRMQIHQINVSGVCLCMLQEACTQLVCQVGDTAGILLECSSQGKSMSHCTAMRGTLMICNLNERDTTENGNMMCAVERNKISMG